MPLSQAGAPKERWRAQSLVLPTGWPSSRTALLPNGRYLQPERFTLPLRKGRTGRGRNPGDPTPCPNGEATGDAPWPLLLRPCSPTSPLATQRSGQLPPPGAAYSQLLDVSLLSHLQDPGSARSCRACPEPTSSPGRPLGLPCAPLTDEEPEALVKELAPGHTAQPGLPPGLPL